MTRLEIRSCPWIPPGYIVCLDHTGQVIGVIRP